MRQCSPRVRTRFDRPFRGGAGAAIMTVMLSRRHLRRRTVGDAGRPRRCARRRSRRERGGPLRLGVDRALVESGLARSLQHAFGADTGIAVLLVPGPALAVLEAVERRRGRRRARQRARRRGRARHAKGWCTTAGRSRERVRRRRAGAAASAARGRLPPPGQQRRRGARARSASRPLPIRPASSSCPPGDGSGVHVAEQALWRAAQIAPVAPWYVAAEPEAAFIAQARARGAYALVERGAWAALGGAPLAVSSKAIRSWSSRCTRCARSASATRPARSSSPGSPAAAAAPSSPRSRGYAAALRLRTMALGRRLLSLNVARASAVAIDGRRVMTAIGKRAVDGPRAVVPLGIEGDEQADLSVHGGPAKAVYAYPSEHYPFWQTVRAQAGVALWDEPLPPGSLGENLTLAGVRREPSSGSATCCAFRIARSRSASRAIPCFKFNAAMGFKHAAKLMAQSAWCGWYLAVREPGTIGAGDAFDVDPGPARGRHRRAVPRAHRPGPPDARVPPRLPRRQPRRRAQAPGADARAAPHEREGQAATASSTPTPAPAAIRCSAATRRRTANTSAASACSGRATTCRRRSPTTSRWCAASIPTACSRSTRARRRSRRCCCARRTSCARSSSIRPSRRSCARRSPATGARPSTTATASSACARSCRRRRAAASC